MRTLAIAIGLAVALLATAAQASQVVLRQQVEVTGSYVRLGDLFTGAGERAESIVAYAPAPGKRAVFDARWLYRVARNHRLVWRPISLNDRAVVRRFSHAITRQEVEDHIHAVLVEQGLDGDMQVAIGNRMLRLFVPGDSNATIAIDDLSYDARSRRFSAVVTAPANDPAAQRVRVTGRVHRIRDVPVLARRIKMGETIRKTDIKWIRDRSDNLQRDIVLDPKELVGMVPRRPLSAMTPVRTHDVRRPIAVKKGGLVIIILRRPGMLLTAKGRALEDGSHGDVIQVSNTQSNTVIDAEVTGTNKVAVRPTGRIAMN